MTFEDAVTVRKGLVQQIGYNDAYLVSAVSLFIEEPDAESLASSSLTEGETTRKSTSYILIKKLDVSFLLKGI
jgi:hypothetical protein